MSKYIHWLICVLFVFYIFTLSACLRAEYLTSIEELGNLTNDEKVENLTSDEEAENLTFDEGVENFIIDENDEGINELASIGGPVVYIVNTEDVSLDDLTNNPMFNAYKNEELQRVIVDIILYTFDFDVDFNNILPMIDEEASRDWFAMVFASWISQFPDELEGMTIVDKINISRNSNIESSTSLDAIQLNFMMRAGYHNNYLFVSVPIWRSIGGLTLGYMLYEFEFKYVDGNYMVIGLSFGA